MYFGLLIMNSVSFSPIVTEVDLFSSSNVTSTFSCWVQVLAPLCQKGLRYLSASILLGFIPHLSWNVSGLSSAFLNPKGSQFSSSLSHFSDTMIKPFFSNWCLKKKTWSHPRPRWHQNYALPFCLVCCYCFVCFLFRLFVWCCFFLRYLLFVCPIIVIINIVIIIIVSFIY